MLTPAKNRIQATEIRKQDLLGKSVKLRKARFQFPWVANFPETQ